MSEQKLGVKAIKCSNCGAPIEISALGISNTIVCKSCRTVLDATHPDYRILETARAVTKVYKPVIELGSFGELRGDKWKVIGFMVRSDEAYDFEWEEYLLYNPFIGFKWLLYIEGHFSLASKLSAMPSIRYDAQANFCLRADGLIYNGKDFSLYNKGKATVKFVLGEFYWRVKIGDTAAMNDYVAAPYMISSESMDSEVQWTISEYLTNKEVLTAFSKDKLDSVSEPWHSVAANQPNPHEYKKDLSNTVVKAVIALTALGFISGVFHRETSVLQNWVLTKGTTQAVSPTFNIPDNNGNLNFDVFAEVNNQWVEGEFTLVNEDSGEDFNFSQGVEYYYGSDSDGSWSEGDRQDNKLISSVPGGNYHLEADISGNVPEPKMNVSISRHGSMFANYLLALALLLLPWLWAIYRFKEFEIRRWQNSDYNPYKSALDAEGDDD